MGNPSPQSITTTNVSFVPGSAMVPLTVASPFSLVPTFRKERNNQPLMVSLSNHMSGVPFRGPLTPFDKLRVSGVGLALRTRIYETKY